MRFNYFLRTSETAPRLSRAGQKRGENKREDISAVIQVT